MRFGSCALVAAVCGAAVIATVAPVQAAATDPVGAVTVSVGQVIGSHDTWSVTASWTASPDAGSQTPYSVVIADHADGSVTAGKVYGGRDIRATTVTLASDRLVADHDYWVAVKPLDAPEGDAPTVAAFHTPQLDTTAPTGSYRLDRTSAYLVSDLTDIEDLFSDTASEARIQITETANDGAVTRMVVPGDGTPAQPWPSGQTFSLAYHKPGTFTPHVLLTDEFANTRDVALSAVRVLQDAQAPTIRITRPAHQHRVASWRRVRGTATDNGTGVMFVGVFVMEKRGSTWWCYDFRKREWLEGTSDRVKTERKSKARPAFMPPSLSGTWRTPVIKDLTRGTLFVEAAAVDTELNVNGKTLTRRIH